MLLAFQKPTSIVLRQWVVSPLVSGSVNPRLTGTGAALCLACSRRSSCEGNGKKSEQEKNSEGVLRFPAPPLPPLFILRHYHAKLAECLEREQGTLYLVSILVQPGTII